MKKKIRIMTIITMIIAVLLSFGLSNIHATTKETVDSTPLESLVSKKSGSKFKTITINKYTLGEKILYRIGAGNVSTQEQATESESTDPVRSRIIRHGYNKQGDNLGLASENDAYMATQLALDYVDTHFDLSAIDSTYQVADEVKEPDEITRVTNIIEKAQSLIEAGFNPKDLYQGRAELAGVGEMQKEKGFVSQICKLEVIDGALINYNMESNSNYSITEIESIEEAEELSTNEKLFKVMIPNEQVKSIDTLNVNGNVDYLTNKIYERTDTIGKFIMLSEVEQKEGVEVTLVNTMQNVDLEDENSAESGEEGNENVDETEESKENTQEKADTNGKINDNNKEETQKDNLEKAEEETKIASSEEETIKRTVLPRTGRTFDMPTEELPRTGPDYFNLKLIFIDLILGTIFLAIKFIVFKNNLKKQTT